jgi:hypothetical protein
MLPGRTAVQPLFQVSLFHTVALLVLVERLMTEFATPLNEFFV